MSVTETRVADDFLSEAEVYRRELFAHCYRMMGSSHDAEDLVQETYLRAWRAYHGFEGRASIRTWLHRIATNACLSALEGRSRRPMPTGLGAPAIEPDAPLVEQTEVPWLEPVPDRLVESPHDPASIVDGRAGVRLALVAAMQHLPPRQRAVLILRDVLRWSAAEVAEALDTSTASVNSALQRARAHLDAAGLSESDVVEPTDPAQRRLLDRYASAMERKDIAAIVALCAPDATWEMPPFVGWYQGAEAIGRLIEVNCPAGPNELRMVATRANGQAAFGMYYLTDDGTFGPFQLQVLEVRDGELAHVSAFFDHSLFPLFGLAPSLPADTPLLAAVP
jgi:RNA polymerase sigma-70 factor (ECF subfamily)